ncbi:hypothetical protein L0636_00820 [Halomonas janggokensis]|uniref:Uncharacterized protein n=1 Tax=Vreelandella janggokensis TaxID=370767 RepID=A0ABT4IRZ7_9GAMM|nr:hypothetical protein [Halomonas janggokensis]MCZ0926429.1 hypothetical protein [Halomonas janggokensis]MCZ0928967.1 hypothetical protein [Halomonas janggokensis]
MSDFDFPTAQLPDISPLRESFANGQIEEELKTLFGDLFEHVARDTFDASVLGAPHLGSFDLVRRTVNYDGLVLLQNAREEAATRYLYRAWKSADTQGRGLHFLRTYLQLLFPDQATANQLWHKKDADYGDGFIRPDPDEEQSSSPQNSDENSFLTSRVQVSLNAEGAVRFSDSGYVDLSKISRIIGDIVPARLVPEYQIYFRSLSSIYYAATVVSGSATDIRPYRINEREQNHTLYHGAATHTTAYTDLRPSIVADIERRNGVFSGWGVHGIASMEIRPPVSTVVVQNAGLYHGCGIHCVARTSVYPLQ